MLNIVLMLCWLHAVQSQVYFANQNSNNIVSVCHCDTTTNFCDYNCCCDTQCSEAINTKLNQLGETCLTNNKLKYCLDQSYYAFINQRGNKQTTSGQLTCNEYDGTATWQPQVSPSFAQISNAVKSSFSPLTTSTASSYSLFTTILTVKQLSRNGICVTSTTAGTETPVYFGRNLTISCQATLAACYSDSITLYSEFVGKYVTNILGKAQSINIPSLKNRCISQLDLFVFYTRLGISSSYVISDIRSREVASQTNPTSYSLRLNFIDLGSQLDQQTANQGVPFFPQIPPDMFYPIFYNIGSIGSIGVLSMMMCIIFQG